jgi:NhaA family Na+:H+ antiporter
MDRPLKTQTIDENAQPTPIATLLQPFRHFARTEAAGGIVLFALAAIGLLWANSPWAPGYEALWHTELGIDVELEHATLKLSLLHWINDGLMALFFFVVGLEIKRAVLVGELATLRSAAVPIFGAVGGMLVPAVIYAALNAGTPGLRGWGVPMATDIAFALGVLALVGRRAPASLRIFLASLAIVDDIGALLVIAIFYTEQIAWGYLAGAGVCLGLMGVLSLAGVRRTLPFGLFAIVLWVLVHESGIHATIAGVLAAMAIPVRAGVDTRHFLTFTRRHLDRFERIDAPGESILTNPEQQGIMDSLEHACILVQTPLQRLEHKLVPWSAFVVVPIFALANAGVAVSADALEGAAQSRVSLGIVLGLLIGKPVGVVGATWLGVKSGLVSLPTGVTWRHIIGAGLLAGIGFTMALFIAALAFGDSEQLAEAKMSVLAASLIAGIAGWLVLTVGVRATDQDASSSTEPHGIAS